MGFIDMPRCADNVRSYPSDVHTGFIYDNNELYRYFPISISVLQHALEILILTTFEVLTASRMLIHQYSLPV